MVNRSGKEVSTSDVASLRSICPDCRCDEKPESLTERNHSSFTTQSYLDSIKAMLCKVRIYSTDALSVTWLKSRFSGEQAGVVVGLVITVIVLIINIATLVIARRHGLSSDGLSTFKKGDCSQIDRQNKIAHSLINAISTLISMQSNHCMQLLASPTRSDVDAAHRRHEWVDIGIQSFRNVWKRHISPWRGFLWVMFAITSVPLHLLWNSVFIFSSPAHKYYQLTVTEGFVRGDKFTYGTDNGSYVQIQHDNGKNLFWPDNLYQLQKDLHSYENLTAFQCRQAYAQNFIRDRSDVITVVNDTKKSDDSNIKSGYNSTSVQTGSVGGGGGNWPYRWLCKNSQKLDLKCFSEARQPSGSFTIKHGSVEMEVKYCLSKRTTPECKLEYGVWVASLIIAANIVKVVCFSATLYLTKSHTTRDRDEEHQSGPDRKLLITTGDAIVSFLEHPDKETKGMSIVEKEDFSNGIWSHRWIAINPMLWRRRSECSWFRAIGLRRWLIGMTMVIMISIGPIISLLTQKDYLINTVGITWAAIVEMGIGQPNGLFFFGHGGSNKNLMTVKMLIKIMKANSPQLLISMSSYLWNNYLVAMFAAREYDTFAAPDLSLSEKNGHSRKRGLRVTDPRKGTEQKPTRFFAMPFGYWLTHSILWTIIHYLASQAVFFVRIDILDHWLEITDKSISQVGYSVLGMIWVHVATYVVLAYVLWVSLRRLPNRMPLASTCSAALSAACHPRDSMFKHHEKKLCWGVEVNDEAEDDLNVGKDNKQKRMRCTFTSQEAYYPIADTVYD